MTKNENLFALDPICLPDTAAFGSGGAAYTGAELLLGGQPFYHKNTCEVSRKHDCAICVVQE
jgi:hypothetical protein